MPNWQRVLNSVRRALMRRGYTSHDAEDLAQEAWLRFERTQREQTIDQPEAFLMKAAINLSIDAYRARVRHGDDVQVEELQLVDTSPGLEATLLAREQAQRLQVGFGRLTERSRAMLMAYRLEGLTYQEISRMHGVSVTVVERRIAKATLQLASWMEGW